MKQQLLNLVRHIFKRRPADAAAASSGAPKRPGSQESARETIEAVTIAFILAFVFKTFEAEAFVIPTGSMAPTLYGRHKEVQCEGCRLNYTIGASQEINQDTGLLMDNRATESMCPNCRFRNDVLTAPVFNGDRIVVNKQVIRYSRFDVVVFKNPEEPHINYIKRLVGLPGETIRIRQGDIQMRRTPDEPWVVQRKDDPDRQNDIQLLVYDDNYPPRGLLRAGAEERWAPARKSPTESVMGGWPKTQNAWTPDPEKRTYDVDAPVGELNWLRYRNLVPNSDRNTNHWRDAQYINQKLDEAEAAGSPITESPSMQLSAPLTPQLIADFCGFNATGWNGRPAEDPEYYWTNDLTLDFTLQIDSLSGGAQIVIEMAEGFRTVRCEISPETGQAEILVETRVNLSDGTQLTDPITETVASVPTPIKGAGRFHVTFANVDDRVCLWVGGRLIPLGDNAVFPPADLNLPTDEDLAPVGIAVQGLRGRVSDLLIRRDLYYRNDLINFDPTDVLTANPGSHNFNPEQITEVGWNTRSLVESLRSPGEYGQLYRRLIREQDEQFGTALEFQLADDEYLMFGDNSPQSKDGRLFDYHSRPLRGVSSSRHAVREQDLIGEAMCIFWPHGIPFLNNGRGYPILYHKRYRDEMRGDYRLERVENYPLYSAPFYPNLSRMKAIR